MYLEEMSQSRVYGVIRKRLYFSELDLYKNWSNFVWGRRQDPPRFMILMFNINNINYLYFNP